MDGVFHDYIDRILIVNNNSILIYVRTQDEHLHRIRCILEHPRQHQLYVSPMQCSFMPTETEFLGFRVSHDGLSVHPGKFEVFKNRLRPLSVTELQSVLGGFQLDAL